MSDSNIFLPLIQTPKVKEFLPQIQESILSGDYNPLEIVLFLKKSEKILKELYSGDKGKEIKEIIENEIRKNQVKNTAVVFGNKIQERNTSYYDFSECGDVVWDELNKIEEQIKKLKKEREEQLKLKIPKIDKVSFGITSTTIEVSYIPKLELLETTDLIDINPPKKGARTSFAFYL